MFYHRTINSPNVPTDYNSMILNQNPLAYYKLDDFNSSYTTVGGETIIDSSGNSRHLTNDDATFQPFGQIGLVSDGGTSVIFNGTVFYFLGTPTWVPSGSSKRTVEFWANPSNEGPIIFYGNNTTGQLVDLRIRTVSSQKYVVFNGNGGSYRYGPFTLGIKVYVAFVVPSSATNLSDAHCIIDGVQYAGILHSGSDQILNTGTVYFRFGRTNLVVGPYSGRLDNVAIYDKDLSLSQAQTHYNAGL